jgi:hypothetical protein
MHGGGGQRGDHQHDQWGRQLDEPEPAGGGQQRVAVQRVLYGSNTLPCRGGPRHHPGDERREHVERPDEQRAEQLHLRPGLSERHDDLLRGDRWGDDHQHDQRRGDVERAGERGAGAGAQRHRVSERDDVLCRGRRRDDHQDDRWGRQLDQPEQSGGRRDQSVQRLVRRSHALPRGRGWGAQRRHHRGDERWEQLDGASEPDDARALCGGVPERQRVHDGGVWGHTAGHGGRGQHVEGAAERPIEQHST